MLKHIVILWIAFAAVMGFAVGGSLVWSLQTALHAPIDHNTSDKEESGADGHAEKEKAEAALARYTWWLTVFTAILALATIGLGVATLGLYLTGETQIELTRKSADAAEKSADVAKTTLVATHRAWLKLGVSLNGDQIKFEENGSVTASISFEIENVGNAPALHVSCHAWMLAYMHNDLLGEQKRKCDEVRNGPISLGFTLFPGEKFPLVAGFGRFSIGINLAAEEVRRAQAIINTLMLYVAGCVDYTFPSDVKSHHQTGFLCEIRKQDFKPFEHVEPGTLLGDVKLRDMALGYGRHAD